jgi:short-subunit dehydrogenase
MENGTRPLAIVTGASTGIGYEIARCCAENGYDLLLAADDEKIHEAARTFGALGVDAKALLVDLATAEGVETLCDAAEGRDVEVLVANAGHGLGGAFLDQDVDDIRHVIDTNVTGTLMLLHDVVGRMRDRGQGRVLITGSIAGFIPGSFSATYNGSKAFVDNFAIALRNELQDTGVTVTCLMPGATDTEFFARAGMLDTKIGQAKKDDPADVAKAGFDAMMKGEADVVSGLKNKLEATVAQVVPAELLAEQHRKQAAPGSAKR